MNSSRTSRFVLRNKIEKIIYNSNVLPCKRHQMHIKSLSNRIEQYYQSNEYYDRLITKSLRFDTCVPRNKKVTLKKEIGNKDEVDYEKERDFIIEEIINNISLDELEIICSDLDFFIRDKFVRDLRELTDQENSQLYQILNNEEKDKRVYDEKEKILMLLQKKKNEIIKKRNMMKFNASQEIYCMKPEDFDTIRQKEIEKQLITTRIKNGKKKHIKNLKMKAQTCQIVNSLISQSEKEINAISEHLNPVRTIIVPSSFHRKMTSITTNNTISHHNNSSVIKAQRRQNHYDNTLFKRQLKERNNNILISKYTQEIKEIFKRQQSPVLPSIK